MTRFLLGPMSKLSLRKKPSNPSHRVEELETRLAPASHTWTGAINGNWSNSGNWDAVHGAPAVTESNVVLNFGAATTLSMVDDIANLNVDALEFSATGYTLSGPTSGGIVLNLTGVGASAIFDTAGGNSIASTNLSIELLGTSQFNIGAGSDTIAVAIREAPTSRSSATAPSCLAASPKPGS